MPVNSRGKRKNSSLAMLAPLCFKKIIMNWFLVKQERYYLGICISDKVTLSLGSIYIHWHRNGLQIYKDSGLNQTIIYKQQEVLFITTQCQLTASQRAIILIRRRRIKSKFSYFLFEHPNILGT